MSKRLSPAVRATVLACSLIAACGIAPSSARAQDVVGHTPASSPYRDIEARQHLTLFGGYFQSSSDARQIAPASGPAFGLRYDFPVGTPGEFAFRLQRIGAKRTSYDPTVAGSASNLGSTTLALYQADLGFALNLTGRRTWHGVIPVIGFGLGVISAGGGTQSAKDPYAFGTQFEFNADLGLRFVGSSGTELRLMATPMFYQHHYPAAYYVTPTGGTALLNSSTERSGFRHAWEYTAGLAIPVFR